MSDFKSNTPDVFSQTQMISEVQEICAPRQRALLSLLAISHKHDLAPAQLVASFADDLPRTPLESRRKTRKFYWSRAEDFAEELNQCQAVPDALDEVPGLLPGTVELALRLEREAGTLSEFNDAWLNRSPDFVCDAVRRETSVHSILTLCLKTVFMLAVVLLVLIRVFPEFKAMMEEFAVEPPPIFNFTAMIMDALAKFWFIPVLLILIAIPFYIPALSRYSKRWNPFIWRQPIWPRSVRTREALAFATAHGKSISAKAIRRLRKQKRPRNRGGADTELTTDKPFKWLQLASQRIISRNEAEALQLAGSRDTQAWLLQKSARKRNDRVESRGMFLTHAVVIIVNAVLVALVLFIALSIFVTLINIMSHLQ